MIDIGDPFPFRIEVRAAPVPPATEGALTDSTNGVLTVTYPDGTSAPVTLTHVSTGLYEPAEVAEQAGRHTWSYLSTNPASGSSGTFDVDGGATGIVSLQEMKAELRINVTTHDEALRNLIDEATEFIEGRCGYMVQREETQIVYPQSGMLFLQGPVVELTAITGAHGYAGTYDVANYYLDSESGIVRTGLGAGFAYPVSVTALVGRAVIPATIRGAAKGYVAWKWRRRNGQPAPSELRQGEDYEVRDPATVPYEITEALERWTIPVLA